MLAMFSSLINKNQEYQKEILNQIIDSQNSSFINSLLQIEPISKANLLKLQK